MGKQAHSRKHRTGKVGAGQRNYIAVAAWERNSAGPMEKRGKGRMKKEGKSRSNVKAELRGAF